MEGKRGEEIGREGEKQRQERWGREWRGGGR